MSLFRKYNVESVAGVKNSLSSDLSTSIELWNEMLQGKAPWNKEARASGIIDCTIGALANPVSEELDVDAPNNEELSKVLKKLNENSKELVQNLTAVGGSVVRPVYSNGKLQYEINRLGNYIPTSYDLDGTLTGCLILKEIKENSEKYLLLEKHRYYPVTLPDNRITHNHEVILELYLTRGDALKSVPLNSISATESLTPAYTWQNVEHPFIVEIRNRIPNKIDGSAVPCALWQNTENLIEDADRQYMRINWEQEGGELRIFADEMLFEKTQNSKTEFRYPARLNKLFVKLNGSGMDEDKITPFAPNLRTAQQVEAFNQILRRCELAWNIGKGTLSDLGEVQQTATQYTGGKKTLYTMIDSIESELEEKYHHLAYVFAYMLSAYEGIPFDDEIVISYNDTARKDPEQLRIAALQEVQNGLMSKWEYRMKFYGEDEATAKANAPEEPISNNYGGFFTGE